MKKPKKSSENDWLITPVCPYDYEHLMGKTALSRLGKQEKDIAAYNHKLRQHALMEKWKRLNKLFDYYKIPENDPIKWMKLADCLAEERFVGLNIAWDKPLQIGRKKQWDDAAYKLLYEKYSKHKTMHPEKSDQEVCKYLSGKSPYNTQNIGYKALQNQLAEAKVRKEGVFGGWNLEKDLSLKLPLLISGIPKTP